MNLNFLKEKISESSFAITGGSGFVGSSIARELLKQGAKRVVLFDLRGELPYGFERERSSNRLELFTGDIRKKEDVLAAIAGCDYVFHKAGLRVTQCAKNPRLAHEILVEGTFNVLAACVEHGVKKIIHASSAVVYGEPVRLPLDEEHPAHDTTFYGLFKAFNEQLLRSFKVHYGLNYVVLRYFNVYGPGMNISGDVEVMIKWLDRIDAGLQPVIFGDGRQTLDYIFIEDVVRANLIALFSQESGEVFNVCTGRETSLLELLEILIRTKNVSLQPEFKEKRTVNHVAKRFGDPRKAQKRLGFRAEVALEEGVKKLVEWRDQVLAHQKEKVFAS